MSGVKNKSMVGMFVIGAAALAVGAVFLLGSGMFFSKKVPLVMYFEGNVGGLSIGAPVVFRGVKIGEVTDIKIQSSEDSLSFTIPVFAQIANNVIEMKGKKTGESLAKDFNMTPEELYHKLIEMGLRAELSQKSFVTGELQIMLDFFPNAEAVFRGDGELPEIPTVTSGLQKLAKSIENLPLNELVGKILSVTEGIDALINSKKTQAVPGNLDALLTEARNVVSAIKDSVGPLTKQADEMLENVSDLAEHLETRVDPLTDSYQRLADTLNERAKTTTVKLDKALDQADVLMKKLEQTAGPDSPTVVELRKALADVAAMARSIKSLSGLLERHPEVLIQGKGKAR